MQLYGSVEMTLSGFLNPCVAANSNCKIGHTASQCDICMDLDLLMIRGGKKRSRRLQNAAKLSKRDGKRRVRLGWVTQNNSHIVKTAQLPEWNVWNEIKCHTYRNGRSTNWLSWLSRLEAEGSVATRQLYKTAIERDGYQARDRYSLQFLRL